MKRFRFYRGGTSSVLAYTAFGEGCHFGFISFPDDATSLVDFIADDYRRLRLIDDVAEAVNVTFSDDDLEALQTVGDLLNLAERRAVEPTIADVLFPQGRAICDGQANA